MVKNRWAVRPITSSNISPLCVRLGTSTWTRRGSGPAVIATNRLPFSLSHCQTTQPVCSSPSERCDTFFTIKHSCLLLWRPVVVTVTLMHVLKNVVFTYAWVPYLHISVCKWFRISKNCGSGSLQLVAWHVWNGCNQNFWHNSDCKPKKPKKKKSVVFLFFNHSEGEFSCTVQ